MTAVVEATPAPQSGEVQSTFTVVETGVSGLSTHTVVQWNPQEAQPSAGLQNQAVGGRAMVREGVVLWGGAGVVCLLFVLFL